MNCQQTLIIFLISWFLAPLACATPQFVLETPANRAQLHVDAAALCSTAKETLAYINKGQAFDPTVIHEGKVFRLPLSRIKASLAFLCQHQNQLSDRKFIEKHFEFYRWYPDKSRAQSVAKPLIANMPKDKILMTKYYVHRAKAATEQSPSYPFPLYALPEDEAKLTLAEANAKPKLTRFQFGKQAILRGALNNKKVPVLAYLSRNDLEAALMQGTLIADFGAQYPLKIFNVDRNNNIAFDKTQNPYTQNRYWYFKQVQGIKGYGKDTEHKITVYPKATFAADLEQLGIGKLLLVQYKSFDSKPVAIIGILADTGGAFKDNLYQVDYLTGSFEGRRAFNQASRLLPDYVTAYFMVLKK